MTRQNGFTLIEIMIVVVIIGILAAIAYPNYTDSLMKGRRNQAKACLQEMSQFMERFYTTNLRYDVDTAGNDVALPAGGCRVDGDLDDFYDISFDGAVTARAYTLQAVPQGVQANRDTACGTLTINEVGVRTRSGTADVSACW